MSLLALTDVEVEEEGAPRPLLVGVSFSLDAGEVAAVVGASGAGKTTLLEVAAGLRRPSAGGVELYGAEPRDRGEGFLALAFQAPERMFFEATVGAEVAFALARLRLDAAERRARVIEALGLVGLDGGYLERHPSDLSGGEQRLVALASVLVACPALLILDEPLAGLAGARAEAVLDLLQELRVRGTAVLVATHEVDAFAPVADRVVALHEGRVVAEGAPETVFGPHEAERLAALGVPVPVAALAQARLEGAGAITPPPEAETATASRIEEPGTRRLLTPPGVAAGMLAGLLVAGAFLLAAPLPAPALLALGVPAVAMLAGADVRRVARLLIPVAVLGVFAAAMHLLTTEGRTLLAAGPLHVTVEGVEAGARAWLRLVGPVLVGVAFIGLRSPSALARDLRGVLGAVPLARQAAASTGLAVLLVMRLAPLMRAEVLRIERAQQARGGRAGRRGASRVRGLVSVAVPAVTSTLLRAERVALALELRGWSGGGRRVGVVRWGDGVWVAGAGVVLGAMVWLAVG